ncbi:hypothetical protein FOA52_010429 [Chlamydomonas sp. UWO 241]|nr:hypothetical protein FOA52_010429 [Chlamydomonas sp. UWO 241]
MDVDSPEDEDDLYEPSQHEVATAALSGSSDYEEDQSQRGGGIQTDDGPSDSCGYTTGFTTGDDDDDDAAEIFDSQLDPLALLRQMEMHGPLTGNEPTTAGLHPYQILRREKGQARRRARAAAGDDDDDDDDGAEPGTLSGAGPSTSGGTGAPRGRRRKPSGGRSSSGVFGAGVEDMDLASDPLAQKLGLVDGRGGKRGRKRKGRKGGGAEGGGGGGGRRSCKAGGTEDGSEGGSMSVAAEEGGGGGGGRRALPEEVSKKLGEANLMYAMSRYAEARDLLLQVIKECPNIADPFHTLGLVEEADGNTRRALDFYMIAAHLTPKDMVLWKRLATLSTELAFYRQAIYCLSHVINRKKTDVDARWDRAVLYAEVGETAKAISQFGRIAELRPGDTEVPKMMSRLYHKMSQPYMSIAVLEAYMEEHAASTDLTHVNILSELYMELEHFEQTHALIRRAQGMMEDGEGMPLDLTVKDGLCLAHLGRLSLADATLAPLLEEDPESYADLFTEAGDQMARMGQHGRAAQFLGRLQEVPHLVGPDLWGRLLACYRALKTLGKGVTMFERSVATLGRDDPRYSDAVLRLAELYTETGQRGKAVEVLRQLEADEEVKMHATAAAAALLAQARAAHVVPPAPGTAAGASGAAPMDVADSDASGRDEAPPYDAIDAAADVSMGDDKEDERDNRRQPQREAEAAAAGPLRAAARAAPAGAGSGGNGISAEALAAGARLPDDADAASIVVRRARLLLSLGMTKEFVSSAFTVVDDTLEVLAADSMAKREPNVPPDMVRALARRQRALIKGGRRGAGAGETETVFVGATKRERRKSKTLDEDARAEAYLESIDKLGAGPEELAKMLDGHAVPGARIARAMLADDPEYLAMFLALVRTMMATGDGGGGDGDGDEGGGGRDGDGVSARLLSRALDLCAQQPKWFPRTTRDQLSLALVDAHYRAGEHHQAMVLLRRLCLQWPCSAAAWSRYCAVSTAAGQVRAWRSHLEMMRKKAAHSVPVMIMQGHVHAFTRSFPDALASYFSAYAFLPSDPLLLLCIGSTYLNAACVRRAPDRNRTVLNGFAFVQEYMRRRIASAHLAGTPFGSQPLGSAGPPGSASCAPYASPECAVAAAVHEADYNLGRAAHQLSLNHLAVQHYLAALGASPVAAVSSSSGRRRRLRRQRRCDEAAAGASGGAADGAAAGAAGAAAGGAGAAAAAAAAAAVGDEEDAEMADACDDEVGGAPTAEGGETGAAAHQQAQQQQPKQQSGAATAPPGGAHPSSAPLPRHLQPGSPAHDAVRPLSREAAHNLAMVYVGSGAPELARAVYRMFLVI